MSYSDIFQDGSWMGEGGLLQFLDGDVAYCLLEDQTLLISK